MEQIFLSHSSLNSIQNTLLLVAGAEAIGHGSEVHGGDQIVAMNTAVLVPPIGEPAVGRIPESPLIERFDK
ncbi:MAG TPA: hypothetical protein DCQ92_06175 [Verrucomicrobia subdivision 3 bacterium]|nr:hypothetical protein [Limisphaerales bacterium]